MNPKEYKNNLDDEADGKNQLNTKNNPNNENGDSSGVEKTFSKRRAVVRILLGFLALVLWFLIGISPTIIFSSSIQEFIGVFSFFVKNPILFLLVAFLNIFSGVVVYIYIGILWWAVFHLLWSIRWFYGYFKYRSTTLQDVIKEMRKT